MPIVPSPAAPLRRAAGRRRLLATAAAAIAAVALAGCVPSGTGEPEQSTDVLFADRPVRQDADVDRQLGSSMTVDAWEANVESAAFAAEVGPNDKAGYLVVRMSVQNTEPAKLETSRFHWKVLTPGGELKSHTLVQGGMPEELPDDHELANDEAISGLLAFNIGAERGTFYVVFAPKDENETRGVWGPVPVA